jgi:hypothetical protein
MSPDIFTPPLSPLGFIKTKEAYSVTEKRYVLRVEGEDVYKFPYRSL